MSTTITKQLVVTTRPAYKVEELLALRGSVSESTVSLDRFGDEEAIKGESKPLDYLHPALSFAIVVYITPNSMRSPTTTH
jgi:hypothetical protein